MSPALELLSSRARLALVAITAFLMCGACSGGVEHGMVTDPGPREISGARLDVQPRSAELTSGDTLRLLVTLWDDRGNAVPNPSVAWKSSNPSVARFLADGVVTAVEAGVVYVTAAVGDVNVTAVIRVSLPSDTRGRR